MALVNSAMLRPQSALQQLLEEINFQRAKEMRQLMKDGTFRQHISHVHFTFGSHQFSNEMNFDLVIVFIFLPRIAFAV